MPLDGRGFAHAAGETPVEYVDTIFFAYINRSFIHMRTGEYAKAVVDCTKAIELDPEYSGAYSNRGSAYALLGEISKISGVSMSVP